STVMNAVAKADVLSENRLFATLDPTTRKIDLPSGREVLLSDTVGFIQKLPPTLVAAFRATLEELESADVLLHVVDVSHPAGREQAESVNMTLHDLNLGDKPLVTALNKIDRLATEVSPGGELALKPATRASLDEVSKTFPNAVPVSATQGWGLSDLLTMVDRVLQNDMVEMTVRLPYSAGKLAAIFRLRGSVADERFEPGAVVLRGKIPTTLESQFRRYAERRRPPNGEV
ncbi:MAG TPA: GTPase, partial [Chloroflexota bacterium]|nr:GTPase [Chloroflexota bacterium]